LRLWLPLLLFSLVVLVVLLALGGWIALYRLERQTARRLHSRDAIRVEHPPALSAARQAQEAEFAARLALIPHIPHPSSYF
jgi:type VI protein secretion system component VasK